MRDAIQALPGSQIREVANAGIGREDDSLAFAKRLVAEQGLGLAPGSAFGLEGEGWLRWCFASRDPARLEQGRQPLAAAIGL